MYFNIALYLLQYLSQTTNMANVAHLVRASGCGSEGRGFDPLHSPQIKEMTREQVVSFILWSLALF